MINFERTCEFLDNNDLLVLSLINHSVHKCVIKTLQIKCKRLIRFFVNDDNQNYLCVKNFVIVCLNLIDNASFVTKLNTVNDDLLNMLHYFKQIIECFEIIKDSQKSNIFKITRLVCNSVYWKEQPNPFHLAKLIDYEVAKKFEFVVDPRCKIFANNDRVLWKSQPEHINYLATNVMNHPFFPNNSKRFFDNLLRKKFHKDRAKDEEIIQKICQARIYILPGSTSTFSCLFISKSRMKHRFQIFENIQKRIQNWQMTFVLESLLQMKQKDLNVFLNLLDIQNVDIFKLCKIKNLSIHKHKIIHIYNNWNNDSICNFRHHIFYHKLDDSNDLLHYHQTTDIGFIKDLIEHESFLTKFMIQKIFKDYPGSVGKLILSTIPQYMDVSELELIKVDLQKLSTFFHNHFDNIQNTLISQSKKPNNKHYFFRFLSFICKC